MPELPEVETVKRGLKPFLEGAEIKNVLINRPDLRWPFPFRMRQRLEGKKILSLRRRSKYLLIDLSSEETLLIHLGMSGRLFLSKRNTARFVYEKPSNQKHDHVLFYLDNSYCIQQCNFGVNLLLGIHFEKLPQGLFDHELQLAPILAKIADKLLFV